MCGGWGGGAGWRGVGVAEGYAPYMVVGWLELGSRGYRFDELSRCKRGDALTCRGHPYMF